METRSFYISKSYLIIVPLFSSKAKAAFSRAAMMAVFPGAFVKNLTHAFTFGYMLPFAK